MGGTTLEDLQYSTSVYGVFMEALLVKGCSVGEAVRRLRNFVSLYASLLQQKSPEGYACYKQGTAAAIHQQLLLGDPALVPCPRRAPGSAALPQEVEEEGNAAASGCPSLKSAGAAPEAQSARCPLEVLLPQPGHRGTPLRRKCGQLGDYYRVAPDAEGITEVAVMSSYLHLHLDLPPGCYPQRLKLAEAKAAGAECLLCGKEVEPPADLKAAFQDFRIPYLLLPPTRMDMTPGWAYAVEERGPGRGPRVHWLVPALVIDEAARTAVRAAEFLFEVETAAAQTVSGRVCAPGDGEADASRIYLVSAAVPAAGTEPAGEGRSTGKAAPEAPLNIVYQALTRPGGVFDFTCAEAASLLTVSEQFPSMNWRSPTGPFKRAAAAAAS